MARMMQRTSGRCAPRKTIPAKTTTTTKQDDSKKNAEHHATTKDKCVLCFKKYKITITEKIKNPIQQQE